MSTPNILLNVNGIEVIYNHVILVLKGVSLLVPEGKVVALVCDNQLFVKPTAAGRAVIGKPVEAPPYPGAKPHFLIDDELDDRDWLTTLVRATHAELPEPKPKKPKAAKAKRE